MGSGVAPDLLKSGSETHGKEVEMRTLLGLALGLVLAGCAGTGGGSGMPCESCKFGVSDKKASPPKIFCKVDGKDIDCKANPSACPGCKK
jgi:hypothetical protein